MRYATIAVASVLLIVLSPRVSAQNLQWYKDQVERILDTSIHGTDLLARNFRELQGGGRQGWLRGSSTSQYQPSIYSLAEGYVYAFVGACDEDCDDLDFALYGPNNELLVQDNEPDDDPVIKHLVRTSGTYTLRATIPSCDSPSAGCYYGVRAYFK